MFKRKCRGYINQGVKGKKRHLIKEFDSIVEICNGNVLDKVFDVGLFPHLVLSFHHCQPDFESSLLFG